MANTDPIWTVKQFQTADIFVMSRSSYSMAGAVLNSRGVVIYPPAFWHAPMPHWVCMQLPNGTLSANYKHYILKSVIDCKRPRHAMES